MADYRSLTTGRAAYLEALGQSHRIAVTFNVYDGDEAQVGTLDGNVVSGQVDADAGAAITKTLGLELEDPDGGFSFDLLGPISAERFIGVEYRVWVDALDEFVNVPVFFGPVSRFSRNGHSLNLEAVGKEALMMPPIPPNAPGNPAGDRLVDYIDAAARAHGERKFRLGDGNGKKLPKGTRVVGLGETGIWGELVKLADDFNMQLFYDGDGYLTLRTWPTTSSAYDFTEVLAEPAVSYDLKDVRNTVKVFGQDAKDKAVLKATRSLPDAHPLSAATLARNSTKRVMLETFKSDKKLTDAEAGKIAERLLAQKSQGVLDVSFEALPVPHLELGDVVGIQTETLSTTFPLRKFSLPLTTGAGMAVGRTAPVSWRQLRKAI